MLLLGSHMFGFLFSFSFSFSTGGFAALLLCFRSFTRIWGFCRICLIHSFIHSFIHSSLPVLGDGYTPAFLMLLGVWEGYLLPGKVGKEAVGQDQESSLGKLFKK